MKALLAVVTAAFLCCVALSHQDGPFSAKISSKSEHKIGEFVDCEFTITNTQDRDYHLLTRNTPLEGLTADIFSVSESGKVRQYDGILVKREGKPSEKEYVLIKAKSSLVSSVELSKAYSFAATGVYRVQLLTNLQYTAERPANTSTQRLVSNVAEVTLIGGENRPKLTAGEFVRQNTSKVLVGSPSNAKAPAFAGRGTSSDVAIGTTAYNAAYNVLYRSAQSVTGNPSLYKTWFGLAYSGYMDTVKGNYLDIKTAMERYQYTLYLHGPDCPPGAVVAYTYFGSTVVYMCDGYFTAPTTGTDSKMGTIVHEMSHAVARTEDIVYGQYKCRQLAASNPKQATNNADNYEYFAEAQ